MHRPRRGSHRRRPRPAGGGAPVRHRPRQGLRGADLGEPPDGVAVELDLVDCLVGPRPPQLRRAVGGEHEEGDPPPVGLDDRGVKVRGRGPRGTEDGRGASRRPGDPEGALQRYRAAPGAAGPCPSSRCREARSVHARPCRGLGAGDVLPVSAGGDEDGQDLPGDLEAGRGGDPGRAGPRGPRLRTSARTRRRRSRTSSRPWRAGRRSSRPSRT